jgi:hypothetical protein
MNPYPYSNPGYFNQYSPAQPIDPTVYYNRQAQVHYEQERQSARYENQDPLRNDFTREASYSENVAEVFNPFPTISPEEQRYYRAHQRAAYRDIGDRAIDGVTNVMAPAMDFISGDLAGRGLAMMGMGIPGYIGGAFAGSAINDFGGQYLGFSEMGRQFSRIDDLQAVSDQFMAGSASGDPFTGRMRRDAAKKVNDYVEEYARFASALSDQNVTSDELREEISTLSENKVLENVKSAEDFARKFSSLRDGVKRMTEILGTTFEEGAKVLGQLRNVGVDPTSAMGMIEQTRMLGTMSGAGFEATNAAGMQATMQLQGSGLGPRGAYMAGVRAETSGRQVYEGGYLSERDVYNLGGPEGIKQTLQRLPAQMMNSPFMQRAMMASFNGDNISTDRLDDFIRGEISPVEAFDNITSYQDMLEYRKQSKAAFSEIMADDPVKASALMLGSATRQLQEMGMQFESDNQLVQALSDVTGLRTPEINLLRAQIKAQNQGRFRERLERDELAYGRAQDDYGALRFFPITQSSAYQGIIDMGGASSRFLRDSAYDLSNNIGDVTRSITGGAERIPETSQLFASYAEEEGRELSGGIYYDPIFDEASDADMFNNMVRTGEIDESDVSMVSVSSVNQQRQYSIQELQNMGLTEEEARQYEGQEVSLQQLANETTLNFFRSRDKGGYEPGMLNFQVARAETLNRRNREVRSAGLLGRGVRNNLAVGLSELSEQEQELLQRVEENLGQDLEGSFGDRVRGDRQKGGQTLQRRYREVLLEEGREVYGNISEEALLQKGARVGGVFFQQYTDRLNAQINQMGEVDMLGAAQDGYDVDPTEMAESFFASATYGGGEAGPEDFFGASPDYERIQKEFGLSSLSEARSFRERVMKRYRGKMDSMDDNSAEASQKALSEALREEAGRYSGATSSRIEDVASNFTDKTLQRIQRKVGDDENKMSKVLQFAILSDAEEKGMLEGVEEKTGRSLEDLREEVYSYGFDVEQLDDDLQNALSASYSGGSISEYVSTMKEMTDGESRETAKDSGRIEIMEESFDKQNQFLQSTLQEMEGLVKNNTEHQGRVIDELQEIKRNTR